MIRPYFALRATKGRQKRDKLLENKKLEDCKNFCDFAIFEVRPLRVWLNPPSRKASTFAKATVDESADKK